MAQLEEQPAPRTKVTESVNMDNDISLLPQGPKVHKTLEIQSGPATGWRIQGRLEWDRHQGQETTKSQRWRAWSPSRRSKAYTTFKGQSRTALEQVVDPDTYRDLTTVKEAIAAELISRREALSRFGKLIDEDAEARWQHFLQIRDAAGGAELIAAARKACKDMELDMEGSEPSTPGSRPRSARGSSADYGPGFHRAPRKTAPVDPFLKRLWDCVGIIADLVPARPRTVANMVNVILPSTASSVAQDEAAASEPSAKRQRTSAEGEVASDSREADQSGASASAGLHPAPATPDKSHSGAKGSSASSSKPPSSTPPPEVVQEAVKHARGALELFQASSPKKESFLQALRSYQRAHDTCMMELVGEDHAACREDIEYSLCQLRGEAWGNLDQDYLDDLKGIKNAVALRSLTNLLWDHAHSVATGGKFDEQYSFKVLDLFQLTLRLSDKQSWSTGVARWLAIIAASKGQEQVCKATSPCSRIVQDLLTKWLAGALPGESAVHILQFGEQSPASAAMDVLQSHGRSDGCLLGAAGVFLQHLGLGEVAVTCSSTLPEIVRKDLRTQGRIVSLKIGIAAVLDKQADTTVRADLLTQIAHHFKQLMVDDACRSMWKSFLDSRHPAAKEIVHEVMRLREQAQKGQMVAEARFGALIVGKELEHVIGVLRQNDLVQAFRQAKASWTQVAKEMKELSKMELEESKANAQEILKAAAAFTACAQALKAQNLASRFVAEFLGSSSEAPASEKALLLGNFKLPYPQDWEALLMKLDRVSEFAAHFFAPCLRVLREHGERPPERLREAAILQGLRACTLSWISWTVAGKEAAAEAARAIASELQLPDATGVSCFSALLLEAEPQSVETLKKDIEALVGKAPKQSVTNRLLALYLQTEQKPGQEPSLA